MFEEVLPDTIDVDEESLSDFCVKIGKYIPGGCNQVYCPDISECPYRTKEIELNPTE